MKRSLLSVIAMLTMVTLGCAKDTKDPKTSGKDKWLTHLNAKEAKALLDKKPAPLVLDIRTPFELKSGTIPGAFPANYYGKDFEERVAKIDRKQPILLHCRSGGRSTESLEIFKKLKFQKIYHLDGGILAWQKEGFPIEKK